MSDASTMDELLAAHAAGHLSPALALIVATHLRPLAREPAALPLLRGRGRGAARSDRAGGARPRRLAADARPPRRGRRRQAGPGSHGILAPHPATAARPPAGLAGCGALAASAERAGDRPRPGRPRLPHEPDQRQRRPGVPAPRARRAGADPDARRRLPRRVGPLSPGRPPDRRGRGGAPAGRRRGPGLALAARPRRTVTPGREFAGLHDL